MDLKIEPIGLVKTDAVAVPRHWTVSNVEGSLVIDQKYQGGLKDITKGQRIVVIFLFHRSPRFLSKHLRQRPPHRHKTLGVFSTCSPIRPNPIGMSILEVIEVAQHTIRVRGLDMEDGTPVLDIKPHVLDKTNCPSYAKGPPLCQFRKAPGPPDAELGVR